MAEIITFCNQKGGVGKTTTSFNIARAFSLKKKNVLVIDLDEQANLTEALIAEDSKQYEVSIADSLISQPVNTLFSVMTETIWENVMLLPSAKGKTSALLSEMSGQGAIASEFRLKKLLEQVPSEFDIVIIDCAPAINKLTVNSLVASTRAVLVTQSQLYPTIGLIAVAGVIEAVKASYNPGLKLSGVIVNQHAPRTRAGREYLEQIASAAAEFESRILEPAIPAKQIVQRTIAERKGIDELLMVSKEDRTDMLTRYDALAKEMLK
ncbi:MAG: AAA family ATPase [Candidatus Ancillula sp.]|jgi:chromosome partitioning protein|nr:AAA family ATPase [Candidatus Ancillula sp.]